MSQNHVENETGNEGGRKVDIDIVCATTNLIDGN